MEGKCSTSRNRSHNQQIRTEGQTAAADVKDFEPGIESCGRSECKQSVSQPISIKKQCTTSASCQSLRDTRPLLPPRPVKHIEFCKSPMTVCSRSTSAKSKLSSVVTPPLSSTSPSLVTNEQLLKPQTPPKPHVELTQGKRVNNLRGKYS
jgi:hypothetical protein